MSEAGSLEHIDPALFLETCISSSSEICRERVQLGRRFLQQTERGLHASLALIHRLTQQHPLDSYLTKQELTAWVELTITEDQLSAY